MFIHEQHGDCPTSGDAAQVNMDKNDTYSSTAAKITKTKLIDLLCLDCSHKITADYKWFMLFVRTAR